MLVLNIAICDNDDAYSNQLAQMIQSFAIQNNIDYLLSIYSCTQKLLLSAQVQVFDIIFINILSYNNAPNALETAFILRRQGVQSHIIFIVENDSFAQDGYKAALFRYRTKPANEKTVHADLVASMERLQLNFSSIKVTRNGNDRVLPVDDIVFVESRHNELTVHLKHECVKTTTPFVELEKVLCPRGFFKIRNTILVNFLNIKAFRYPKLFFAFHCKIIMQDGMLLSVPLCYKKNFHREFFKFRNRKQYRCIETEKVFQTFYC